MVITNGDQIFLRWLESDLILMLGKNELSSAASVRKSKYITKAIGHAQSIINADIPGDSERKIIEELISELEFAYGNCTTSIGGRKKFLCNVMSDSGYEEEIIVLKSRIQDRFLPEIRKMSSERPLFLTERDIEERKRKNKTQGKGGRGDRVKKWTANLANEAILPIIQKHCKTPLKLTVRFLEQKTGCPKSTIANTPNWNTLKEIKRLWRDEQGKMQNKPMDLSGKMLSTLEKLEDGSVKLHTSHKKKNIECDE